MPIKANDIDTLHKYAIGVMNRSNHHAENVGAVDLTLLGEVIWRAKPGTIKIRTYDGNLANVVWWISEFIEKNMLYHITMKNAQLKSKKVL